MNKELYIMIETYPLNSMLTIGYKKSIFEIVRIVGHDEHGVWVVSKDDLSQGSKRYIKMRGGISGSSAGGGGNMQTTVNKKNGEIH